MARMKTSALLAVLVTMACTAAQAGLDDEKLIGTYAMDCKNIAKGAVILTLHDAQLVAGEKITTFADLSEADSGYFGKYDSRDYRAAIALRPDQSVYLEVFNVKKSQILKMAGSNDALLPFGLAFNSGQNTFRKCPLS